ncbi:MAG TPA: hypothetical protein VMH39_15630 [Gemmatimonadaceae bacterium]|nr:hypothetical protein [Gemmatimonadaceae bacterium]
MSDLSRQQYLAAAGHQPGADLQEVYRRYANIFGSDVLAMVREAFVAAPTGSDERRQARMLLEWQAEAQASRELAALDEREITWRGSAVVRLPDGRAIEFERAPIEMADARDHGERRAIERARGALVAAELAPIRRERFQRERDLTEALGLASGYNATFDLLSGIPLAELAEQCRALIRDTQAMWDETYADFVKRRLGIDPREATRGDALAVFRAPEFDGYFPGPPMRGRVLDQVRELGIDPTASGRITIDADDRPGKRSRAFCAPVRVPDEVYLVVRPQGGHGDWTTFLHELGHALHFAYMRADLPFEDRWVGDNSVTESFAMLWDHLLHDKGWLARYTDLDAAHLPRALRAAAFEELHYVRRYSAKLLYEIELYRGDVPWNALPDLYAHELTAATTFRYGADDAFVDVDPRFYSARYLRAWQLQGVLNEALVERYDDDWWRNPRAGPWIRDALFAEGQRELGQELAVRVSGKRLGFGPLIARVEGMLA